jgi:hypothetical protein
MEREEKGKINKKQKKKQGKHHEPVSKSFVGLNL